MESASAISAGLQPGRGLNQIKTDSGIPKGVSTGDFGAALAALLGKDVFGLSATTIARLKDVWIDEHKQWSERDLSAKELRLRLGRRVYL
jgi:hypothetical protein